MENVAIQQNKSQLAKLLATENITVQHKPGARTAWFDVKNRILCLPVWREMSNDLYDLLVVHEVGHALDTPADGWIDSITDIAKRLTGSASNKAMRSVKGFLNVIEDARIDKRQKRRFPGARRNYVKGYQELIERDFFGTKTRDVNSMSFIDRLNIYCKGGSMLGIKFTPEEKALLAKVEAAETFEEVIALTEEIFKWSKDKMEEQEQNPGDFPMPSESDEDEEGDGYDDSDDSDEESEDADGRSGSSSDDEDEDGEDSDDEAGDTDGNGDADSDDSDDSDDAEDDSEGSDGSDDPIDAGAQKDSKVTPDQGDDMLPESETEKAWERNSEDLVVSSNDEYHYIKLPRPLDYNKVVIDYKKVLEEQRKAISDNNNPDWAKTVREDLMQFKADESAAISFMVKEFEMRKSADEHARTSISKTGVIDTNKLHSYKYNDDLFRRMTTVATGKNHGFVMFIDWSGSMNSNLKRTMKQLFSLVMFCKRVQIPFEVYSFRTVTYRDIQKGRLVEGERFFTSNKGEVDFDNFYARNILSSRMKIQELNDGMFHLWYMACGGHLECDQMGSTPLNECIGTADLIVNKFRAQSKVQVVNTIFLTDGESDPLYTIHGETPASYGKRQHYIVQDEITKKSYDVRANPSGSYYHSKPISTPEMTTLMLRILKDRTGCNLVGFFINGDGFDRVYYRYNGNGYKEAEAAKKSWKDNGFFPVASAGYDEYYILNPKSFNVSSGNLKVDAGISKRKLASEFAKFAEKKTVSRVLLSRFVKRIAA